MNIQHDFTEELKPNDSKLQFYKNILVPVDLSKDRGPDFHTAIALAEHYDANLWLLGFSSEPAIGTDARGLCHYVWSSWDRRIQVRLWDLVLQAREQHYKTFPLFIGGQYDAEEIIRTANSLMADLIVIPTEEEGQTDELVRKSAAPVFVAVREN